MSVLNRIAYFQNRRDEVPNQELAHELACTKDTEGIREIANNLWNTNKNIQSDCLKVLYYIGYVDPELIAEYLDDIIKMLKSRNNQIIWGSMMTLSTIAHLKAEEIYEHHEEILKIMENGSVITIDNGVKTLAIVASKKDEYRNKIFPYLLKHLETCRPKDVPQHSEKILVAVDGKNKDEFIKVLEKRTVYLSRLQMQRVKKVISEANRS